MVTIVQMIDDGRRDPIAVTVLAIAMAKEWCEDWGGWDNCDTAERIGQIWACRPRARKLFRHMPKAERQRIARAS